MFCLFVWINISVSYTLYFIIYIIEEIILGLKKDNIVKIHNFGTFKIRNKKSNELIDIFSKKLNEDSQSFLVIHDNDADLHGSLITHFQKIKLGPPGEDK